MYDGLWRSLLLNTGGYEPWLRDRGSLTLRIQQRCRQFEIKGLSSSHGEAEIDELARLGFARKQRIYAREVFLVADGKPVVFAHSVVGLQDLRGVWQPILHLGAKPLGALLFSHPLVRRAPLQYRAINHQSGLYRRATQTMTCPPAKLWARRSTFELYGAPLLVTEVFLPEVLRLDR